MPEITPPPPRYSVYTWDHDVQGWSPVATGVALWSLRPWLRGLYEYGWSAVSVLVTRDGGEGWAAMRAALAKTEEKGPSG